LDRSSPQQRLSPVVEPPDRSGRARQIATYVEAARGQRAPEPARQAAFKCILDLLGAAAAGIGEPGPVAVRQMAVAALGAGKVPIWFSGLSASVIGAAWANSAAAAALDLDDGNRLARGHPGAAVIPTAIAVAAETGATLEDIIGAIAIGYEVGVTIGAARTSYGNTGTWSSYAVVATAAALRRTSRDVLEHALAIAGESAPNQLFASAPAPRIPDPEGSDVKEGIPWSVVTGLFALGMAEGGHTGPRNILDSARLYNFPGELALGSSLHICRTYFKLYSCCRHVHSPVDALLQLIDRYGFDVRTIDAIEVETYSGALRITNKPDPANTIDVQFSIPYCLALAAIVGPQTLLPVTADALTHDGVTALARKVKLSLNSDFDAVFPAQTLARVTVICGDRRFVSDVTEPKGEATSPLSWDELEAKLRAGTRFVATDAQQNRLIAAVNGVRDGSLAGLQRCLSDLSLRL
jgi:2-methylcitrate dehydratase PrpD